MENFLIKIITYWLKKEGKNFEKKTSYFLAYTTPWPPMSVHKKYQPNRSSRLASYTYRYANVLFYYIDR